MYKGKETSDQSLYSGRIIRGLTVNRKTGVEADRPEDNADNSRARSESRDEIVTSSVNRFEEPREEQFNRQSHHQIQREEPNSHSSHQMRRPERIRSNTPKDQVLNCIERGRTGLIGVFGMNSDNAISEALREIRYDRTGEFCVIGQSRLGAYDVFTMFASSMLKFVEEVVTSYRDDWQREAYRIISEIGVGESDFDPYEYGLTRLSRMVQRLERDEKCKELIRYIKNQRGMHNTKFIWNIEIDIGGLNHIILSNLSRIASQDLIIIVNTLGPLDCEVGNIGAMVGYGNPNEAGYGVLHKYMGFQEIVRAD